MKDKNSGHDFVDCSCNKYGCGFCTGKIRLCTRCEGINQSLTSTCCGYLIDENQRNLITKGRLNYYHSTWHVSLDV